MLQKTKIIKSILQRTKVYKIKVAKGQNNQINYPIDQIIKSMLQKTKDINIAKKRRSSLRKECFRSAANMYGCSLSTFCMEAYCIMFEFMRLTADQSDPKRHNFLELNFFLLFIKRGSFSDILSVLTHNQLCCL